MMSIIEKAVERMVTDSRSNGSDSSEVLQDLKCCCRSGR